VQQEISASSLTTLKQAVVDQEALIARLQRVRVSVVVRHHALMTHSVFFWGGGGGHAPQGPGVRGARVPHTWGLA
jgi:hypothetical protein